MDSFTLTQEQVAQKVGKSRPAVANALRLLQLPEKIIAYLTENKLSAGHARALAGMKDKSAAEALADRIVAENLTVRDAEKLAAAADKADRPAKAAEKRDSYYGEVELSLRDVLGRRVSVSQKGEGGMLSVEFLNKEELAELVKYLGEMK